MVANNRCATQIELLAVLQEGDTESHNCTWVEHLECCPACVERLTALAARQELWNESREQLIHPSVGEPETDNESRSEQVCDTLAHYRIDGTIGYGGMATVYRGFDPPLHRPVAIKILHEHLSRFGSSRQRFLREAQAAAAIAHPNVIPIYGVHHEAGKSFLVMPLIQGGSLQQRLDREGPLPLEDMLRIALQVCEGLNAAHAQGVVHRDVKPANILLEDGNKRVILSDFGLARTLDDATLSASGIISGTPAYMSPEQARGEQVDFATDLFSLGSVMFAMCTGHPPYQATSSLKLLRDVSETPFPSVHRYQERLPLWVDRLIAQLTAPLPQDRIASTSQAVELIRLCLQHVSNSSCPLPEQIAHTGESCKAYRGLEVPASLRAWKRYTGLAVMGVVVLAGVVAAGYFLPNRHNTEPSIEPNSASEWTSTGPLSSDQRLAPSKPQLSEILSRPTYANPIETEWDSLYGLQFEIDQLRMDIESFHQRTFPEPTVMPSPQTWR